MQTGISSYGEVGLGEGCGRGGKGMAMMREESRLWGLSAYCILFCDSVNLRLGSSNVLEGLSHSLSGCQGGYYGI